MICFKYLLSLISLWALISCVSNRFINRGDYIVDKYYNSVSQDKRQKFLIIHYTSTGYKESLYILSNGLVSAHYLIPDNVLFKINKPVVLQLVDENNRAWHAGDSFWHGRTNINDSSIGIEIVNLGFTEDIDGNVKWHPYKNEQIRLLISLLKDIINRYKIEPDAILAHSDIAPTRKQDPGAVFPWERLYKVGIGAWPDEQTVEKYLAGRENSDCGNVLLIQSALKEYGYDQIPQDGILNDLTIQIIKAFQLHFRPELVSGIPDAQTEAIALALVEKYRHIIIKLSSINFLMNDESCKK